MADHKEWPRDLIQKGNLSSRKEFKSPEEVPPGWFTIAGVKGDEGYEINPPPPPPPPVVETKKAEKAKGDAAPPAS